MQHSASSIALAERCHRAWWLRYREKLKPPELPWLKVKRMRARGEQLPPGAFSKALGKELHRLAELYLYLPPRKSARLIDWNDLPGQCLAELVPHLPPPGSVPRRNVEARMSLKVRGVRFRGLIDLVLPALARAVHLSDHKTSRDIRTYALLPDAVAQAIRAPKRSLKNDLQACLYVLARVKEQRRLSPAGGLCRWNYTETQRTRRSLPVVQYIPTAHARTIAERAARTAEQVESFKTIEDATPNTTACDQYGGCWYRSEGHCLVPRKWGAVFRQLEREQKEQEQMGKLNFKALGAATTTANADEEAKAKKATKAAPPPEAEEDEDAEESEDEEDEAPAPKPSKRVAKKAKAGKGKRPEPEATDDADDEEEDEDEPEPAKPPTARDAFNAATAAPDHILQFFKPEAGVKGEAKILATAFSELADHLSSNLPRNPERAQCLRRLLEAKDCAVRAVAAEG